MTGGYVPLHVHSHFSIGRGIASPERLARAAADAGFSAIALTDTGNLAGWVRFVRACRARGVKAIVGCELTVRPEGPEARAGDDPAAGPLVFLAQSEVGYRALVRMVARAHEAAWDSGGEDDPGPPRKENLGLEAQATGLLGQDAQAPGRGAASASIASTLSTASTMSIPSTPLSLREPFLGLEAAGALARDLVVLTGGRRGELWRRAHKGDIRGAEAWLGRLVERFGAGNVVVQLVNDGAEDDHKTCQALVGMAERLRVMFAAAPEIDCPAPSEALVAAFARGEVLDGRRTLGEWLKTDAGPSRHLAPPNVLARRFWDFPEALANTLKIAERCSFEIPAAKRRFPIHDFVRGLDADSFLWDAVFRRATQRYGELTSAMKARLNREFDDLRRAGLCNALVFLCRMSEELDRLGVVRGPGSGPLATSLIASVLGLTRFDPVRHGLDYTPPRGDGDPFPVFRVEVPTGQVTRVVEALNSIYDGAMLCSVGRWERWRTDGLVEALARWTGLPAERVPMILESDEWREALADENGRAEGQPLDRGVRLRSPEVFAYVARRLEGAPRALAEVAGQYALAVDSLTTALPRQRGADGAVVAQLEDEDLEHLSLARLEFAHHPLLDVLDGAARWVCAQENPGFRPDRIPAEDPKAFQILAEGWTMGVQPLESPTARAMLQGKRPATLDELAAIVAELTVLSRKARPGAPVDAGQILAATLLSYACAWVKAHHPAAFYAAALTHAYPQRRRFRSVWREARRREMTLLPPDVNLSGWEFSFEGRNTVRCGLMAVGGLGRRGYEELDRNRRGMAFFDLNDLARRTDSRRVRLAHIENLIRCGACDGLGPSRATLLAQLPMVIGAARPKESRAARAAEPLMFFDKPASEWISEMTESEVETPNQPDPPARRLALEQQAAGFAISADPLDLFADLLKQMEAISAWRLTPRMEGKAVRIAGYVEGIERSGPLVRGDLTAVLDVSGCLVQAPEALKSSLVSYGFGVGPVVVAGTLEREAFTWRLRAESILSLQTIWEEATSTERLVLDLSNADRRTLKAVTKLLKRYPGQVPVQAQAADGHPKRLVAALEKLSVLPCPPMHEALERLLGPGRMSSCRRRNPDLLAAAATTA